MPKVNLTSKYLENLDPPEKQKEIWDKKVEGLGVRIMPSGYISFFYRYRLQRKNQRDKIQRYTIGQFPGVELKEARKKVWKLKIKVAEGEDPQAQKKARKNRKAPATLEEVAEKFKEKHLPGLRESTRRGYRSRITKYIVPALGSTPIRSIEKHQILDLLERIANKQGNPTQSNRVRAVLSSMFTFAMERGYVDSNPVQAIKPVTKEKSRKRIYDKQELKALWEAFEKQAEPMQSLLKMLLICGQRLSETRKMQWQHLDNGVWKIPAENTKAKRVHYVPLSDLAFNLIDNLAPLTGDSQYVFESQMNKGNPLVSFSKVASRIRNESEVKDFRIHDLRRSAASYMAKLGVDRTVLGKLLNHKGLAGDSQVTAVYDRYEYMDEKRRAMIKWSAHINDLIYGQDEAKITKIS